MNIIDFETYKENDNIVVYCICYIVKNEKKYVYYSKDIFFDFFSKLIEEENKDMIFFTHNINFDGYLIINFLTEKGIYFEWFVREMNLYWIEVKYLTYKFTFRCSYKIIPISIKNLGEMIKENKKVFPHKFSSFKNLFYIGKCPNLIYFNNEEDYLYFKTLNEVFDFKKTSIEYCFQDVLIIKKVLENIKKIVEIYGKSLLFTTYSFSSLSYKIFKKKFDLFKITENKINNQEYLYIKKAYYGGRCEVFGNVLENEIIHYFDFSGMYAQCMLYEFPVEKGEFKKNNLDYNEFGLHSVKIFVNMEYPLLPTHYNKKLIFPNGTFVGIYTNIEINAFIKEGGKVLEHYSSYIYKKKIKLLINLLMNLLRLEKKVYITKFLENQWIMVCMAVSR